MCIRDRFCSVLLNSNNSLANCANSGIGSGSKACLLYTSDAADDLTRVDLGGRRVFQAEDGIRALVRSRGLGDVYKRQVLFGPFEFEQLSGELRKFGNRIRLQG